MPEIIIAPNPVDNEFVISFSIHQQAPVRVNIYHQEGRKVLSFFSENLTNNIKIEAQSLSAGLYLVEILGENVRTVQKIRKE